MRRDLFQYPLNCSDDYEFYVACARRLRRDAMARIFSWRSIASLLKTRLGQMQRPPSTSSATPVINSASSEAR